YRDTKTVFQYRGAARTGYDLGYLPALCLFCEQGLRHALRGLEASRVDQQGSVEALLLLVLVRGVEVGLEPHGALGPEPVGVDVAHVELPQGEHHRVEDDGRARGDGRREYAGGHARPEGR